MLHIILLSPAPPPYYYYLTYLMIFLPIIRPPKKKKKQRPLKIKHQRKRQNRNVGWVKGRTATDSSVVRCAGTRGAMMRGGGPKVKVTFEAFCVS